MAHKIKTGWLNGKNAPAVILDRRYPLNYMENSIRWAIKTGMLYGSKCLAVKKQHTQKNRAIEMRMLISMSDNILKDWMKNENTRDNLVTPIEVKMRLLVMYKGGP